MTQARNPNRTKRRFLKSPIKWLSLGILLFSNTSLGIAGREPRSSRRAQRGSQDGTLFEIPVLVKDSNGIPVRGLTADQFHAFQGKDECSVVSVDSHPRPLAILFMFDWSGSSRSYLDNQTRDQISHAVLNFMTPRFKGSSLGALSLFAERAAGGDFASEVGQFSQQVAVLTQKPPAGSTALWDAVDWGVGRLKQFQQERALVLVSDGEDNESHRNLDALEKEVVEEHVRLFFINTTALQQSRRAERESIQNMEKLTHGSGGEGFVPQNEGQIARALGSVSYDLDSTYHVKVAPPQDAKQHKVDIRVSGSHLRLISPAWLFQNPEQH